MSAHLPTPPWERPCVTEGCTNMCRPHPQPGEAPLAIRYWSQAKTCKQCKNRKAAARQKRLRQSRIKLRLCTMCGDPLPKDWEHNRCPTHHAGALEAGRRQTIRRRALGLCAVPGCKTRTESFRCEDHEKMARAAARARRRERTPEAVDAVIEQVVALP